MTCNDKCIHFPVCEMKNYDFANIDECMYYAESLVKDSQQIVFETPKTALETIQKHCEHQDSCMDCSINQVCDFCFMGQPKHWDLSEVKEE